MLKESIEELTHFQKELLITNPKLQIRKNDMKNRYKKYETAKR